MSDEPNKGKEDEDQGSGASERARQPSGSFDPVGFAQEILGQGEDEAPPLDAKRPARPTLVDEEELEAARVASIASAPPVRGTALSLANLQAPSVPPAPGSSAPALTEELSDLDRGWDSESPTAPRFIDEMGATGGAAEPSAPTAEPPAPPAPRAPEPPAPATDEASFADLEFEEEGARPTLPGEITPELVDLSQPSEPRPVESDDVESGAVTADPAREDADAADRGPETPAADPNAPPSAIEMADRVALGDYSGALEIAEKLLALDPEHEEARTVAEEARETLLAMYTARIGDLEGVPVVAVARDELRWLSIDHRAGFVLSLIDGVSTLEMVLDVSGMPRFDALRIVHELLQKRIIAVR